MEKVIIDFDLELKNIDSIIKSHNIYDLSINRKIREYVMQINMLVNACNNLSFIKADVFNKYKRLIYNRLVKLDNAYFKRGEDHDK